MKEPGLSVLVVEDDSPLRATLEDFLSDRGLSVTAAKNPSDAVERIQRAGAPFDVVLTDLIPNGADGVRVFEAARRRTDTTEVVVMSGFSTLEATIDLIKRGAFDYITKPFKLAEIEIVLGKIIERKRLLDENRKLSERVQNLYSRLDKLKDHRDKLDRFAMEINAKLDDHTRKIDQCLELLHALLG